MGPRSSINIAVDVHSTMTHITDEGREKAEEHDHIAESGQAIVDAREMADTLEKNGQWTERAERLNHNIGKCLYIVMRKDEDTRS